MVRRGSDGWGAPTAARELGREEWPGRAGLYNNQINRCLPLPTTPPYKTKQARKRAAERIQICSASPAITAAMKLKINKACDLGSISVLPPRRTGGSGGTGGVGASGSSAAPLSGSQQQRSQPLSQQSFSQSQLSQGSLDENLLSLHLASPARDQRVGLHDDSSKKMPSLPVNSASCVREETQLQLAKIPSNSVHRWNPSPPDSRCQIPNEDVERKFQHLASSVHKMGMVLDSVQNDVMQLNRAMKEASLDSGSIQQKVVVLDNSLQKILKGQDDLKALVESSIKSIADQLSVLNSHSSKLDEISSTLSVWPKQIEIDLRQLQSDIFRIFTKEMEGIVRAIRSLNNRPATIQIPTDQSCTTNVRPPMHQLPIANERLKVNQTPVATMVNQTPVANGRHLVSQTPTANGKTLMNQTSVGDGRSLMSQVPAANGKSLMSQIPAPNGRPVMSQRPGANGRSQMNQIHTGSGKSHTNKIPAPEVNPAPLACPAKMAYPHLKVEEEGKMKALPQKLTGSRSMVTPKQEEVPSTMVTRTAAAKKAAAAMIIIDSDDDSEGRGSCVILKSSGSGDKECHLMKEATEESQQILRRARKRRRREMQAIVPAA
ncbi:protein PAIR1-like isoform X2 [Panicum virgatum]|uniref:protein PAIR1-like isoform X2 n=1 Tax=Panicum virgatum TaxID=38727 RepID=UPI0019D5C13A|nr:protein PAIR1-like isoform X2 [Panicum virgatum]